MKGTVIAWLNEPNGVGQFITGWSDDNTTVSTQERLRSQLDFDESSPQVHMKRNQKGFSAHEVSSPDLWTFIF